jgi:hypothetical protein
MQKSTGKELAIQAKRLSKEGCRLLELMNEAEDSVYRNVNLANYRAWRFGKFLAGAKAELGHGRFTIWRAATFPNVHERKAQRCQELFAKNSKATELSDFSESAIRKWIIDLNKDSVRKFRLGYVPVKERLLLEGDEKVTPTPHHLTFVNEFFRYNRQLRTGKIEYFDLDLFRREIEPMAHRLIELCGVDWFSKLCAEEHRGNSA